MKLGVIAEKLGAQLAGGSGECEVRAIASLEDADEGCLTFLAGARHREAALSTRACAVLVPPGVTLEGKICLQVPDPYLAYARVAQLFEQRESSELCGVASSASVDCTAVVGQGCSIGPGTVIGPRVRMGAGCEIGANCTIERDCDLGAGCRIDSGVVIRRECVLGERVIVQANSVIGSEGFGNARDGERWVRIPCFGTVRIENEAEIGACVTIDRGNFGPTVIGEGARIDNLVHIAHNCVIGPHTAVAAQSGFSGSTIVGRGAIIAGQAGFAGHLTVGDGAFIGAKAGVSKSVPPHSRVTGYPARDLMKMRRIDAALQQLPQLVRKMRALLHTAPDERDGATGGG